MCWPSMRLSSPCTTSSSTPAGCPANVSVSSCAAQRTSSMPKLSLLTCPDLVHLYMTRRGWPRPWKVYVYAGWPRLPTSRSRPCPRRQRTDREVTTRGDDSRGQGRAEPAGGQLGERPPRRGGVLAALCRRPAHRVRTRGRRG